MNSRQVSVFVFSLDSDSDRIGQVSEGENKMGAMGTKADTWSQSMPQTIKRGVN